MKKIEEPIVIYIPPVRLFLEDLKAIEQVYKECSKTYKIKIRGFELDSIDELKNIEKTNLSNLSFESQHPDICVSFSRREAKIYSSQDSVNSIGIVTKLKSILDKRITPLRYLSDERFFICLLLLMSITWVYIAFLELFLVNEHIIWIVSSPFIGIMIFWGFWLERFKHSLIFLTNKRSRKNFFSRNKDQILLSVLSAIAGALIALLVKWIFSK